jgi:tetratricopeptide (TPR) repeat protein
MTTLIKTTVSILALAITSSQLKAQEPDGMLSDAFKSLQTATGMGNLMAADNKFTLIVTKWSNDWAANYYAAYAAIYISLHETNTERKDQLLDQADKYVEKLGSLRPSSDEGMVITAYAAYARFLVDQPNRWQKYLELMTNNLDKAKKVNPNNPRIYYLEGIPIFNKQTLYGGGKDKAKPYFAKAKELFVHQDTNSITKPYWGEKDNADYLVKCDQ